jgi:hypothetical protein
MLKTIISLFLAAIGLFAPGLCLGQGVQTTPEQLVKLAPRLSLKVAELALNAARCADSKLEQGEANKLAVIDYSLPSVEKRFWVFDLNGPKLVSEELVAHGKNSGLDRAGKFSNRPGSLQSSLGLFGIGGRYTGKHGNSLRLIGLEQGINHLAEERAIVIHGADYVSEKFIGLHQRLGRSFGCPALGPEAVGKVIDHLTSGKSFLFSYYPDEEWLAKSALLNRCGI